MCKNVEDVLQLARKMEMDGMEFYSNASENASNTFAARFFNSLADDERRHLKIIENISEGMGIDVAGMPLPADSIRTVFSQLEEEGAAGAPAAGAEEKEAVDLALEMEKKSFDLYAKAAKNATNDTRKKLFERLELEENQHYEMLQNTSEYLNDNQKWFLNSECGLLTGDMSPLG